MTAVVVFDLGGVVCRWLPERRLAALAARAHLPVSTVDELVFGSGFDDAGERGRFDLAAFERELAVLLGLDLAVHRDGLRADWSLAYEPTAAVLRAIGRLAVPAALLTNNGPLLRAAFDHELADVAGQFDHLLFSCELGAAKPEPEAFDRATAALGVEPGEVVFFDDSDANVTAAQAAGWQAHRFTTVLDAQAVLGRLGR